MKSSAPEERKIFWSIFEKKLVDIGNPFYICHGMNGETTHYASVNKYRSFVNLGLTVDFLYRDEKVRINIYIQNDVDLFNYLHLNRGKIEQELNFKPQWIYSGEKNPNTRRVISTFPIAVGNPLDYERVIEKIIPIITQYKKVFTKYIPMLCDY